jgi:hypothetical protein
MKELIGRAVAESIDGILHEEVNDKSTEKSINSLFKGEYVIIRTYSAGVWFGKLTEKEGQEVVLHNARRMWRWHAKQGVSLSGIAQYGINSSESRICVAVEKVWLEAIEIIRVTKECKKMILESPENEPT